MNTKERFRQLSMRAVLLVCAFSFLTTTVLADPPPAPSSTSHIGDTVTNPATGATTTVSGLIQDPAGTPTQGATAFVQTADGYVFVVKVVGQFIYNHDNPPLGFKILSADAATHTVQIDANPPGGPTATLSTQMTLATYNSNFFSTGAPPVTTPPVSVTSPTGVRVVSTGNGGSNGRDGAVVVPPESGGSGDPGPTVNYTTSFNISATNQIGLEAGSIGGKGGKGGDSYLSFWDGRDGGNGGAGGTVNVTNAAGVTVASTGSDAYGIFAYSRSGAAGDGGSGFAAPGGGTGGHSSDGGAVNVTNNGGVTTNGAGAYGIYGLSVSNNGGNGGSQWGLVGQSGDGGFGGSGGPVSITNGTTGNIQTFGLLSHGILAQSVGGTGGSSGTSGNLLVSLNGSPDNGGNGGAVSVTNDGSITTGGGESRGIFAQSIGGGGGTGGSNGGLIALGGSGSNGGSAGTVTVTNSSTGTITTSGVQSDGIFAQSVGGSGGSGSNAGGLVAVGGDGAKAGNGGAVTVSNFGTISTTGNTSRGIVAQSIGGGGGDGGSSGGLVAVGGSGDGGGSSSTVTVTHGGTITTTGTDSTGIFVQSVGGGGGNGGSAGSVSAFAGVAVGGTGGGGGAGGNVNVTLQGHDANTASLVRTDGDRSAGVFAQSVGGGGGAGGGAVQVTGGIFGAASVAVGGNGGDGGAGGTVNVSKGAGVSIVDTGGADSPGVILQSVGGGGGNGGYAVAVAASVGPVSGSLSVAVGGDGGSGGTGGTVNVGSFNGAGTLISTGLNSSILTTGDRSAGLIAQSVGGGGGNGGLSVSAAAAGSLFFSGSVGISLGGGAGGGGAGGTVSVGTQGNITTQGELSTGLLVQSVGGGGGNGGGSVAAALSGSGGGAGSVSVGLGGSGGSGGIGGTVTAATRAGTVTTQGDFSSGIVVQSVGGGGGNGGFDVSGSGAGAGIGAGGVSVGLGGSAGGGGDAGTVKADLQSTVNTSGTTSTGILVQSVGGGGGNGGLNVSVDGAGAGVGSGAISVGLGGTGGSGGVGKAVNASSTGSITTQGDDSAGFIAQSIGGGGGNGGFNISGSGSGAGIGSGGVSVGLGGSAGAGNDGGVVVASQSGTVSTAGNQSLGVMAQSVGGGGGNGGFNISASGSGAGVGSGAISVGLGGKGGAAGDGDAVTLTVSNNVNTGGNTSTGVVAQSIGGGGGNGGFNVSASGSGAGIGSGAIDVGLGGAGASGGGGGTVSASVTGNVGTLGSQSNGILVQSLGGGGGSGGFNVNAAGSGAGVGSGAISVGIGGSAGGGGSASAVSLTANGNVTTAASESRGVVVQSIGGGGGNGGLLVDASGSGAGVGSGAIAVGVGGSGGSGGGAGTVNASVTGNISTDGRSADGYVAQSIGGGGGNGALTIIGAGSGAGVGSGAVSVGVGGSGGSGGDANTVNAGYAGTLTTRGDYSTGFLAQAVGGGGGNAGGTISVAGSGAGVGSGSVSVGVGGGGGAAGDGQAVTLSADGSVETFGAFSSAVVAQSIGGGGGNGGYVVSANGSGAGVGSGAVAVGVGGGGAKGGDGKSVDATVTATVHTHQSDSTGVLAQSVGGGGGNGGFSVTAAGSGAGTGSGGVSVGLGGGGDQGGSAGNVTASSTRTIQTDGDRSSAFVAQSIGGGGGNGGFNVAVGGSGAGTGSGAVSIGLGGTGAGGGAAGSVNASTSADITTLGNMSTGILAQSLGGGGGNGGFNVNVAGSGAGTGSGAVGVGLGGSAGGGGNASTVDLAVDNNVNTSGSGSAAVIAQSIGGGGGNGGFNVNVTGSGAGTGSGAVGVGLGGNGGGGGNGARVTTTMTGDIATVGANSTGLLSQSVGGGGGNGGFNVNVAISGAGTGSGAVSVGLGGSGGSGGTAGDVTSTLTGDVQTAGNFATAVTAQSIGGGGGNGGFDVSGTISGAKTGSGAVSVGIGGSGGGGGVSGAVDNTVTGDVHTSGLGSGGVLAQSVGGGGGAGGFNISGSISGAQTGSGAVSVGIGGGGGTGGNAGTVANRMTGNVITNNGDAFGIAAQSIGGGGGNGGLNVSGSISAAKSTAGAIAVGIGGAGGGGGDAANVTNTVTGYVLTTGARSAGITTQSLGGGGGNGGLDVSATITAAKSAAGGLAVGVGGFGGDGGNGADATSTVTGAVITLGAFSPGISTQSLGGGGGNGGLNVSAAVNLSKENGGALGVGVGGFGGDGGNAGNVSSTVTMTPQLPKIFTFGSDSSAVSAQSLGGGGGNGGINVTGAVNLTGKSGAAIGVGVGAFGGGSGNAGNVTVDTKGDIATFGNNSNGLIAQSVGGGGGNGGINVTGSLAILKPSGGAAGTTVAASIGVGGFGGGGGQAGNVDVTYDGTIVALPRTLTGAVVADPLTGSVTVPSVLSTNVTEGASGLVAQSIGGGGGNGAINVSGGVSYGAKDADGHALLVGVGGFGGVGGNAGDVTVNVTGPNITAFGGGRSGILASSIGGGGGNGGLNVSGGIVSDSPLIVGVGGLGGNGGTAGDVTVTATTDLRTRSPLGNTSSGAGLMAQSLGGGGGNGGLNVSGGFSFSKEKNVPSITVGVGGFGGAGAVSGDVTVTQTGTVTANGAWTHGVFAQSIAGGGGNGALNVSGEINFADSKNSGGKTDLSIVAGIGGFGGAGANAGDVSVTSSGGTVTSSGDYSRGIFAQSVGGGGGTGGMNVSGVFAKNSSPLILGVGGFGSGGGNAGSVAVTHGTAAVATGKITTSGSGGIGIEASSIGGGGGDAGMNFQAGFSLAGKGAGGGGGGGGGGSTPREHPQNTGVDDAVFTNYDKVLDELEKKQPKDSEDATDANKESAFFAQVAIGGAGGVAGNGAAASVHNHSDIETFGVDSHGILAQSIGGGGGNASLNLGAVYEGSGDKNKGVNVAVGGQPGDGGTGGTVEVTHQGLVTTWGRNSTGVLAQSIGGGGGNVGFDLAVSKNDGGKIGVSIGRVGGTGGSASDVTLSASGTIETHGDASYGLLAQSVGNGGGNSSAVSVSLDTPKDGDTPARTMSMAIGLEGGHGGSAGNVTLNAAGGIITHGEDSHGVFAQSVGGGGGNGGAAQGLALLSSTYALAIGGTGGEGGTGGNVTVGSSALVETMANRSVGILAQSIGGAGGTGGMGRGIGFQSKGSGGFVIVGGSGGTGMRAGDVTVDNSGIVITHGEDSHGVLAQSIGGGGGNAGLLINEIRNGDAAKATEVNMSIGGSGGTGATSGSVTVTNTGGIGTAELRSAGIFAQSVGGGGGNANYVITSSLSGSGAGNKFSIGIGGSGGDGGAGGAVSVFNRPNPLGGGGQIITLDHYSPGILAMSIGGGGGTGSDTITANRSGEGSKDALSFAFSLGGSGGKGGTGGTVLVENAGSITTYGYQSHGIAALSIGGGGGAGGMSLAGDLSMGSSNKDSKTSSIAIGGFGGSGNKAGDVTVHNTGTIDVHGDNAYGIFAESVGGGGGDGGFAAALSPKIFSKTASSLLTIGIGGFGGVGGDAGNVVVEHSGTINSYGSNSYGIFAQSVGGGGGHMGFAISNPLWAVADYGITAALGAREASGGKPGTVTVNTTGTINMYGANSQAQFTQAVSGGGGDLSMFLNASATAKELGDAGFTLPDNGGIVEHAFALIGLGAEKVSDAVGSAIDATHVGDLYTWGKNSITSFMQSVGGGGGNADTNVVLGPGASLDLEVALGAKQASHSSGGDVSASRSGNLQAAGERSQGMSVQSVGGGGGRSVINVSTVSATDASAAAPSNSTAKVGLGADPSFDNNGGSVDLHISGDTVTLGDYSPALVLQSIGAGGGQAFLSGLKSATVNVGAADGSTGNGGNIQLANTGTIATAGALSDGVVLQSIGGGGGYVITDLKASDVTVNLRGDNAGNGGNITFTQNGDIVALGDRSRGVVLQSVGGGGGLVDGVFSGSAGGTGSGGSVDLHSSGNIFATGVGSTAILAQSVGGNGADGNITIDLAANKRIIGGAGGVGIALAGGAHNSVLNRGLLTTMSGARGFAITGTTGDDNVDNFGTIVGSVDLGSGANNLINRAGASFAPGATINLGAAGTWTNFGTFDPGGDSIQQTTLTGNFTQIGTPRWLLDIGQVGNSDGLAVSGRAELRGSVTSVDIRESETPLGTGAYRLITASGGLSGGAFKFGTLVGAMPIGRTFTLDTSDTALDLNLRPSTGTFFFGGDVSGMWNDPFVDGFTNWTRSRGGDRIYGTPGAASDVVLDGANTGLGADFTIGSLSGTGSVSIDGSVLTTGANGASTTWAGTMWGNGRLVKTGSGTFTLTGTNLYDGTTTVAGGQLLVQGWLGGSSVRVMDGAVLAGNGTVQTTTIASGGMLAPGASIGALTVNGDLTFEPGAIYSVETDAAGTADVTWTNGSIFGSGATLRVRTGGTGRYHPITTYGIVRAKGANAGIFSNLVSDASFLNPSVQVDPVGMYLTLRRNDVDFRSTGTRGNQTAVASALNGLVRTAFGDMAHVVNDVYDLSNEQAVRAIGSMSGVVYQHAASSNFAGAQTFLDVNLAHIGAATGRAGASNGSLALDTLTADAAANGNNHGAWFSSVGWLTRLSGGEGDPAARGSNPGFAVGYDGAVGNLLLGASLGKGSSDVELDGVSDRTTASMLQVAGYARYQRGASRFAAIGGGSGVKNNTTRSVTDGFAFSGAHASYDGSNLFTRLEYGHAFASGTQSVEPQIGFQYIHANVDGFTEQGAGVLNLVVPARHVSSARSLVGARAVKTFGQSAAVTLGARAAWAHEFSPLGSIRMQFLGDTANNTFDVVSPARLHDSAVIGASASGKAFKRLKFVTSVDGDVSKAVKVWTANVGLRAEW